MDDLLIRVRTRLLPSILTSLAIVLLSAGLLTYTAPVTAGPGTAQAPTIVTAPATLAPTATPLPSGSPTPTASAVPTPPADRVATRVVIQGLKIDLPIIREASGSTFPPCDVAMYITELGQPGFGRATYLYAHARTGMFLPILTASRVNNGAAMLGMLVEVYTSDDQLFVYKVSEIRRHQLDLDGAIAATTEQIWLQTSEGPRGTLPKTQLVATFVSSGAADPAAAHPTPRPVACS